MQKITYQSIRTCLIERRENRVKWKDIGKDYPGVPLGTLCRIAKDANYEPKESSIRIALGLHPLHVTVEPCARCGSVHVSRRCTANAPKYAPHPVTRISWLTNIDRAKREFEAHYPTLNFTPIDPGECDGIEDVDYWNRETQLMWQCWLASRMVAAEPHGKRK